MIKPLPQNVINQIAAGEVVERPASVVKELIENSLDANSSEIRLLIHEFGTKKIQVIDNGTGIAKEDFQHLLQKHSTSKISSIEELNEIKTFGFRGEALASIASVAKITLQTKHQSDENGSQLYSEFGTKVEIKPYPIDKGTNVIVEDLFACTPARKKFLKTKFTENKAILDTFYKFVLSNPEVSFYIDIDGINKTFPKGSHLSRFAEIIKEKPENLIQIDYQSKVRVSGFIVHPRIFIKNRHNQFIFVNNRSISDSLISRAIADGLGNFLMKGQFPGYVIFIEIHPSDVDVNVHPRKTEVRFSDPSEVYRAVRFAVNQTILRHTKEETTKKFINTLNVDASTFSQSDSAKGQKNDFENFLNQEAPRKPSHTANDWLTRQAINFNQAILSNTNNETPIQSRFESPALDHSHDNYNLRIDIENATQLMNSYIVTSNQENILIIDQHAASERCFYERYLKQLKSQKVSSKVLLVPENIEMNEIDVDRVIGAKAIFERFGFEIEQVSPHSIKVIRVPDFIKMENFSNIFDRICREIIDNTLHQEDLESMLFHEIAALLACHTAVRFGDRLTKQEISVILKELIQCENPYNCPHGRPIILDFEKKELEKKFRRCSI